MSRQSDRNDAALDALAQTPDDADALLLHAGRHHPRWARHSILSRPRAWFRHHTDGRSELIGLDRPLSHHPWHDLRALLNDASLPGPWIGYLSYDLGRVIEPRKLAPPAPGPWPLIELAWCPEPETFRPPESHAAAAAPRVLPQTLEGLIAETGRDRYQAMVARALQYIAAGDVFQVNLAQRFAARRSIPRRSDVRALYAALAAASPAWYGACLDLPEDRALCSTSPELFLEVEGSHVITRPIKGTRPAGDRAEALSASDKDAAELNMIVDLMRNDLGRVCRYGSVRVDDARHIESHPTVWHGVATVSGELHPQRDLVDLLRATLPGGSVTGAPKVRAMQIIDELEREPRGPYCGAIGFLERDRACLNVAIRTMCVDRRAGAVDFSVGAGIVADSDPQAEHAETIDKAQAMLQALLATRPAAASPNR